MTEAEKAYEVVARLCRNGYPAYIVGGAVRDELNDEEPKDHDIATNAEPHQVMLLFPDKKVDVVGVAFKVAMVDGIEVATYRKDFYPDGMGASRCKVERAKTILEDLARRDLTINAMAYCPYSGEVIDPYDGRFDLYNKIIRFVGDADLRIEEDPCRILRACRFLSKIEGTFADDTFLALIRNVDKIKLVAPERIRMEIMKVLSYNKPSIFFEAMYAIGALQIIFPELAACYGHDGGKYHGETIFRHNMLAGNHISSKFPLLRLAGYLHDIGKPVAAEFDPDDAFVISFHKHEEYGADIVEHRLKQLKFSTDEVKYVRNLVRMHMRQFGADTTAKAIRRLLKVLHENKVNPSDLMRIRIADRAANLNKPDFTLADIKVRYSNLVEEIRKDAPVSTKMLAIDGRVVMQVLGIPQGKQVGEYLNRLLNVVIEQPSTNEKDSLIQILKTISG